MERDGGRGLERSERARTWMERQAWNGQDGTGLVRRGTVRRGMAGEQWSGDDLTGEDWQGRQPTTRNE